MPEIDPSVIQNLDANSRKEIMQWIEAETSKSKVQSSIHNFTDMCWKKCITNKITSNTLDSKEEQCLQNCLHRFLDTNINVVNLIQQSQR
ncbi:mitochondrial import inner membrane translocase subunit Tim8p [Trichomonascus vanleenenianus]|uniref:protein transporter TIM8 n=1 Tax=Trichomonascus vanleenenianus TaxID=2268995 RepID=UPI003ECBAA71